MGHQVCLSIAEAEFYADRIAGQGVPRQIFIALCWAVELGCLQAPRGGYRKCEEATWTFNVNLCKQRAFELCDVSAQMSRRQDWKKREPVGQPPRQHKLMHIAVRNPSNLPVVLNRNWTSDDESELLYVSMVHRCSVVLCMHHLCSVADSKQKQNMCNQELNAC